MKKINIFGNLDMSPEGIQKRLMESYERSKENLENMSYWLPKIANSTIKGLSVLQIPETKIIPLDFDWWRWLRSDRYTPEKIKEFNDYLVNELGNFRMGESLFMKTGIFSNKFTFSTTTIEDNKTIGDKYLAMFYQSMMVGADNTAEVVFRQNVKDSEHRNTIYDGMPLRTEFRVFYDFDTHENVGVANYWHPEELNGYLKEEDKQSYAKGKEIILKDYERFKVYVAEQVKIFMEGCSGLTGKWSVDVMKNGQDYWLIDMARMERSALVNRLEEVTLAIGQKVKVRESEVEGIISIIDREHPNIAVRIEITKGRTPVTDYYLEQLEIIEDK